MLCHGPSGRTWRAALGPSRPQLARRDVCRTWGGVALCEEDRTNALGGSASCGEPLALLSGRGTRRETPALGTCRTGAPPGAQRIGKDSPSGESRKRQHRQGSREEPHELGSAVIHAPFDQLRRASEKVAGAEALGKAREEEKTPAPPQPSINLWQVGGQGLGIKGDRRDPVASDSLGKLKGKGKTLARADCSKKKREGIEGKTKTKHRLTPSLRSYFRAGPEDIVLVPGQGKMDTFVIKDVGRGTDAGMEAEEGFSPLFANSSLQENTQAGMAADMICQDRPEVHADDTNAEGMESTNMAAVEPITIASHPSTKLAQGGTASLSSQAASIGVDEVLYYV
ncbi:hypothetical protein NDU88_002352 [Pleurodeles waltl]|uniref:Uncharacterized protein n=1 Tax=Pleurodeles waltl TaxID=8319 RepID=A0AAV7M0N3_PLEWA|nr:hypothetical protein NDU88_002352 [Pleurodeles waltl]